MALTKSLDIFPADNIPHRTGLLLLLLAANNVVVDLAADDENRRREVRAIVMWKRNDTLCCLSASFFRHCSSTVIFDFGLLRRTLDDVYLLPAQIKLYLLLPNLSTAHKLQIKHKYLGEECVAEVNTKFHYCRVVAFTKRKSSKYHNRSILVQRILRLCLLT